MKIGILHFTDLHFNAKENFVLDRFNNIFSAIRRDISEVENIYIVVTGDIVDKGQKVGYNDAETLLTKLGNKLLQIRNILKVKYIIVPGNHDCDFKVENQLRKNMLQTISYNTIGEDDDSVIDICTNIQEDFWNFYLKLNNNIPTRKLFYQIEDKIEDKTICFNCFNTSWMSQIEEQPKLFFPIKRFDNKKELKKGNINISVFHHPIHWFTSEGEINNRKEFQQFLEDNSSLILYGHEHEEDHKKSVELWSDKETLYFSGKILQGNKQSESGFQLLVINTEDKKGIVKPFTWQEDIYVSPKYKDIQLNGDSYSQKRFKHNEKFLQELDTLKIPISIENKDDVKLSDFYVFPDLECPEKNSKDIESFYDSKTLITETDFTTCLIEGENQSGKSSLISMLYRKFTERDIYPLIIDCRNLKSPNIETELKNAFKKQYIGESLDFERFEQYKTSKKVVLLDNLHELKFNPKTIKQIINDLEIRFGKVIISSNTLYGLVSKIEAEFDELKTFTLRPLGYKKRNELIENYHKLSLSINTRTDEMLLALTKNSYNQVEAVLGDKLMPSYPVFILSILQTLVYAKPNNYEQTSYGYCYHSLIHIALYKKANVENEYIDTFFNLLSEFALELYKSKSDTFSDDELEVFFNKYGKKYHVGLSYDVLKQSLLDSQLIINIEDEWRFSYEYIYYFLVARRIAELIGTEDGKDAIRFLCANLHEEKNAKILVFIAHHTKDDFLIDEATFTAMVPFEDVDPITLEKRGHYYDLLKDIVKEISSDVIEAHSNPMESRNEILESRDKMERENIKREKELNEKDGKEDGFNELMTPFFQAFRAIEIVGQIIKNRKGSIPSEQLINMIVELYNTAFRTISHFGKSILESKEEFTDSLITKVQDGDSKQKIEERVNSFFQFVSLQICLGVFGKVIYSVGQKDLRTLFVEVAKRINTPAADLVTFSINSYYGTMSTGDLQRIVKKYEKNHVAMEIIIARVKSYLYQNFVDYKKRQTFASTLKMRIGPAKR